MSRFAQYYIKYKQQLGCYDWEDRQQHLGAFFKPNSNLVFSLGNDEEKKIYKHRVYNLSIAPNITVMRFANDIDIDIERDFEPAKAKDEPSCFVIIDNRANLRTVAIQKRRKAFSNTRQVAQILSTVIDQQLFSQHCYGFEILPDYYPTDLFTVWERKQAKTQSLRFAVPVMEKEEIMQRVDRLMMKDSDYLDDSILSSLLDVIYAQKQAKYKGVYTVMPEDRKSALYIDKKSVFMRNMLTYAQATDQPVELVTSDGGVFRCFIENEEDVSDKIVSHEFNDRYLETLFARVKKDGSQMDPEDRLKAEEEVVALMNSMKHEVVTKEEEQVA